MAGADGPLSLPSSFLHYLHHLLQRLRANLACPCEGMVKDIYQKQNQRDRYRKRSRNHVLRLDILHPEEKRRTKL